MSVVLGWLPQPIGGMSLVQQGFFDSIFRFINEDLENRKLFAGYTYAANAYIPAGRNQLVKSFLETNADQLLMLDWDVSFTTQNVYSLVDQAKDEWDVVQGCYVTWFGESNGLRPCWFVEKDGHEYVPAPEFRAGEVIPLSVVGMGFTLIHREMFLKMERASNDDPWPWFGHDHINTDRVGEDITFSARARRCGARLWGHGGVQLGHTKAKTMYPEDLANPSMATSDHRLILSKTVLDVGGGDYGSQLPPYYDGWNRRILDIKSGPRVDYVKDARDMDFDQEFEAMFSSHSLEHFEIHDIPKVLKGMYNGLKPGGVVEIICPDFGEVFRRIDSGEVGLHDEAYVAPVGPILYSDIVFGYSKEINQSGQPYYCHRTAITTEYLTQVLTEAGFEGIEINPAELEIHAVARRPE